MNYLSKINNETDPLQAKVFARWISSQIKNISNVKVENITKDLSNGVALIELAEVLTHKKAPRSWNRSPNTDIKNAENCDLALNMFQADGVKLVGISGKDISDNNQKLISGLIWSLILHYSIGSSVFSLDQTENKNIINNKNNTKKGQTEKNLFEVQENALLSWALDRISHYSNVQSFRPYELAICALLDSYFPEKIHFYSLNPQNNQDNLKLANDVMSQHGIQVFIYNEDIFQNNNKVDRIAILTQLAAIKSTLDNKVPEVTNRNLDEKESESEWDLETESQTEQISEAEAILEQKEIIEEARIKKEEEQARRKAILEKRRQYINDKKIRRRLVQLKVKEEAKLRAEVAQSRAQKDKIKSEEDRIKFEEKRIKAEEQRIKSEKDRIKDEEQNAKEAAEKIRLEENEIKRGNNNDNLISNDKDNLIENKKSNTDSQKNLQTKEDKKGNGNTEDKKYNRIITKKHYNIKMTLKTKNVDLSKIKALNLGVRVDDNETQNGAKIVTDKGDAYISLPSNIANNENVKRTMTIKVKKDGKVINVNEHPTIINNDGEKQTYHVKLL